MRAATGTARNGGGITIPSKVTKQVATPRPRHRGRPRLDSRREEVLRVAAAYFSSRGYAAATLEDIGGALGMTRAALYYYAESKEDLLVKCYDWTYDRFRARLDSELTDGTGRDRLIQLFAVYSEIICDDASRCFLSAEAYQLSPSVQEDSERKKRTITNIASAILDEGIADGSLRISDKKCALTILFGAFNHLPQLVPPGASGASRAGQMMIEMLLNGLAGDNASA
jgi:AcrR family transcriptional regulator